MEGGDVEPSDGRSSCRPLDLAGVDEGGEVCVLLLNLVLLLTF